MENTEENKLADQAEVTETATAAENVDANTETVSEDAVQDAVQDTAAEAVV